MDNGKLEKCLQLRDKIKVLEERQSFLASCGDDAVIRYFQTTDEVPVKVRDDLKKRFAEAARRVISKTLQDMKGEFAEL